VTLQGFLDIVSEATDKADDFKPVFSRKPDMKIGNRESTKFDQGNFHAPAVPEKPLKFQKLQLERLLSGEINPNDKPVNRQHIEALLIPLNNALRKELSDSADSAVYKV
jgi:hypothetical protein